ncbi:cytochrome c oxidase assembly protein [Sphingomonas sp. KR1UV-12]|uniref:Cytochrome c oxidase assembly protein n=1 Tax=Sphingomonas aurea TaxID=3063994 RepID=A0ABT9EPR7_9SPHN|nr:cytochrome c oxidase assembly protein [Sphingomonas sp. KR1UV-12]MDP1028643.1 cytochrome c oxidase assembly protein [Sphingomonas sp. KR1UV-12]
MKRAGAILGLALLPLGWAAAAGGGMTGHMVGHMLAVAVAAPLLAWGLIDGPLDLARRAPRLARPMPAMVVELAVVWGWHLPAARALADAGGVALVVEQAMFLAAGLLLWASVLGTGPERRASGVGALLLTSMHMTLLGALIGLAPRPLYAHGDHALADQQLGGVVMLMVGAASYFLGGLAMLATLLRQRGATA